jgi:hypothetical protein
MRYATAALAALLAAAACSSVPKVETDPETGNVDVDFERIGHHEAWTSTLAAVGGSGVSGSAGADVADDDTHAATAIRGRSGGVHPWHIHEGKCGDNGPIVGPASAYPPLRVGADGRAAAMAHLDGVELNEAKNYYVNVHASPTNLGTIVACGALDD